MLDLDSRTREFEQGTQILALTQSVRPANWWAVKTAVSGVPIALAMLALGFVNRWALATMVGFVSPAMGTPALETRGVTPAVYFVLAYSIAVTAGILLRNSAVAIGATVLVYVAVLLVLGLLRPHYLSPESMLMKIPSRPGTRNPFIQAGQVAWQIGDNFVDANGDPIAVRLAECPDPIDYQQCIVDQGVVAEIIEYQTPDSLIWRACRDSHEWKSGPILRADESEMVRSPAHRTAPNCMENTPR